MPRTIEAAFREAVGGEVASRHECAKRVISAWKASAIKSYISLNGRPCFPVSRMELPRQAP